MHHLQTLRAAPCLAETPDAYAATQTALLLRGEIKKTQREKPRTVRDPAQHLPSAAEGDLGEQHVALHCGASAWEQLAQRHHARAILVTQRQEEQQVLRGFHTESAQLQGERVADAAQHRDRLEFDHRATMHSTSTC